MPEIIVAYDNMAWDKVIQLAEKLKGKVWGGKINDRLVKHGTCAVQELSNYGNVMADPKLFDIPNTMENACNVLDLDGANIVTVHCLAGEEALRRCSAITHRAKLFGITILTSMSDVDVKTFFGMSRKAAVYLLLGVANQGCLDGVVCSADSIEAAKAYGLKTIVPGVRLPELGKVEGDDQKHLAVEIPDCDYIVVGRPITLASDPVAAVEKINEILSRKS